MQIFIVNISCFEGKGRRGGGREGLVGGGGRRKRLRGRGYATDNILIPKCYQPCYVLFLDTVKLHNLENQT